MTPFIDVSRLLNPRSIAVIGASDAPGNFGGAAVRFLRKFNSPCAVWPVNPGRSEVAGLRCYPDVASLPGVADLALIAVAAPAVAGVVQNCAAAGITAGVAWAGGFVEGGPQGLALQEELAATCRASGFALQGPNCIGIIDTHAPMIASFASMMLGLERLLPGNISMISQSGGMATIAQALAQQNGYGFRYMISTGNEAVLTSADFVQALVGDALTKVICLYLEGARDGEKFRRALLNARAVRKPVIVLKAGATAASAGAAAAHTGALVGESRVWNAVLDDAAAIRVESLEELLDVAMQLSGGDLGRLPRGTGVAAVTFGGGIGVLSADQCDRLGLDVPPLGEATRAALNGKVPPLASTRNPVDLTPQAYADPKWFSEFPRALDTIAADPMVETIFFQMGPMARGDAEMARIVADFRDRSDKAVVAAWPLMIEEARAVMQARGVHVFPEYSRAVRAIARLARYGDALAEPPGVPVGLEKFDWSAHVPEPLAGLVISEHRCHEILAAAGLPVAAGRLARSAREAVAAAEAVGYPVVLKGISPAVTHRAAAGLLALGVTSAQQAMAADAGLRERAAALGVALDGVYVQHMVSGGVELLVSALRDPLFGVMVSVGAGGGMTELIDDVVVMPVRMDGAPMDATMALRALRRLRILRNTKLDVGGEAGALVAFVVAVAGLAAQAPWRRFVLEVNPIKWSASGVTAVDGLLVIDAV